MKHKIKEFREILKDYQILSLADIQFFEDIGTSNEMKEMEDYQIHLGSPEDTTLYGTINHSFGQDIVALNEDGKEIARISLKGNNGDEESFSIVIPASVITKKHNPTRIKGTELSGKVLETNTKMVSINMGNE